MDRFTNRSVEGCILWYTYASTHNVEVLILEFKSVYQKVLKYNSPKFNTALWLIWCTKWMKVTIQNKKKFWSECKALTGVKGGLTAGALPPAWCSLFLWASRYWLKGFWSSGPTLGTDLPKEEKRNVTYLFSKGSSTWCRAWKTLNTVPLKAHKLPHGSSCSPAAEPYTWRRPILAAATTSNCYCELE